MLWVIFRRLCHHMVLLKIFLNMRLQSLLVSFSYTIFSRISQSMLDHFMFMQSLLALKQVKFERLVLAPWAHVKICVQLPMTWSLFVLVQQLKPVPPLTVRSWKQMVASPRRDGSRGPFYLGVTKPCRLQLWPKRSWNISALCALGSLA